MLILLQNLNWYRSTVDATKSRAKSRVKANRLCYCGPERRRVTAARVADGRYWPELGMASARPPDWDQPPADAGRHMACLPGPLKLTAEELMRELVEEHKDATFEYRGASFTRKGHWVGGSDPIEDCLTKQRFQMLEAWCKQVSIALPTPVLDAKTMLAFRVCASFHRTSQTRTPPHKRCDYAPPSAPLVHANLYQILASLVATLICCGSWKRKATN
jgi:hypothetical protein